MSEAGLIVVWLATAHPMGPMSPFHWCAGFSSIGAGRFLAAIAVAGLARAAACSYFGSTLFDIGSGEFYLATALLLAAVLVPMLHPVVRQKVFGRPPEVGQPAEQD